MDCSKVLELMEEYETEELEQSTRDMVENHLKACPACAEAFEKSKEIIFRMRNLKNSMKIKEGVLDMSKREIIKNMSGKRSFVPRFIPAATACIFFTTTVITGSVLAFPSFALKYVPDFPAIKELVQVQKQNETVMERVREIEKQNETIKKENEELKIRLKDINGTQVKEVNSGKGIPDEENTAIQAQIIDFIKAQYKGDIDTIKGMCTDELKKQVEKRKQDFVMDKNGDVIFTQITNVAKEDEKYLVFVRLNDTGSNGEADYQENFELVKINGKFLVSFVGKDA